MLLPQPLGDRPYRIFRSAIDRYRRQDEMRTDRGDIHHMAVPLRHEARQRRGDPVEHAVDVDVDHPIPLFPLERGKRRQPHHASIVDKHVDVFREDADFISSLNVEQ